MLLAMLKGIAIFFAGPTLAFAVLSIGCDGPHPALGVACGHNAILSLVAITFAIWVVLITALSVRSAIKNKL
jgi:hypothetical protein